MIKSLLISLVLSTHLPFRDKNSVNSNQHLFEQRKLCLFELRWGFFPTYCLNLENSLRDSLSPVHRHHFATYLNAICLVSKSPQRTINPYNMSHIPHCQRLLKRHRKILNYKTHLHKGNL